MDKITRVRKHKKRYGITNGPSFLGFHWGLRSWYYLKPTGRSLWSIKRITDNKGKVSHG